MEFVLTGPMINAMLLHQCLTMERILSTQLVFQLLATTVILIQQSSSTLTLLCQPSVHIQLLSSLMLMDSGSTKKTLKRLEMARVIWLVNLIVHFMLIKNARTESRDTTLLTWALKFMDKLFQKWRHRAYSTISTTLPSRIL